ncbi:hypothetical protein DFH09DRAFT_1090240 [Mycena vulgaris]|nr:hypothetical protein DFH09DRAFT_1090240 [Mycena vulgaris]
MYEYEGYYESSPISPIFIIIIAWRKLKEREQSIRIRSAHFLVKENPCLEYHPASSTFCHMSPIPLAISDHSLPEATFTLCIQILLMTFTIIDQSQSEGSHEPGGLSEMDICGDPQPWLEEYGYMLRPRFRPGWVGSWKKEGAKIFILQEDGFGLIYDQLIDAVRIKDGTLVALEKIEEIAHPDEVDISTFLFSEPLANDPKNHCVPLLEFQTKKPNFTGHAKHITRTQAPLKYYLIDFGISVRFGPGVLSPHMAMPIRVPTRLCPTVPEFVGDEGRQYNPQYVEHYAYGRVGFEFMRPLAKDMVNPNPQASETVHYRRGL